MNHMQICKPSVPSFNNQTIKPGSLNNESAGMRKDSMLMVDVPERSTFLLPEGVYWAKLTQIKQTLKHQGKDSQKVLRLIFRVNVKAMEGQTCLAGRNFPLNLHPGSELSGFLTNWLGEHYLEAHSGKQMDLMELIDRPCILELGHFKGVGFKHPMTLITNIYPVANEAKAGHEELQA